MSRNGLNLLSHDFDASNLFGPAGQIDMLVPLSYGTLATGHRDGTDNCHQSISAGHYGVQADVTLADGSVVLINTTIVVESHLSRSASTLTMVYEDLSDIANAASVGAAL